MSTHNFRDGIGEVPAHQYSKGGGWVADTAFVARHAVVYGYAVVLGLAIRLLSPTKL